MAGSSASTLSIDGQFVVGMEFRPGLPIPSASRATQVQRSYSHRDGVTRETPFEMSLTGVRYRPGGVRLRLGEHPYAERAAVAWLPEARAGLRVRLATWR